jgi:hypothetical protein
VGFTHISDLLQEDMKYRLKPIAKESDDITLKSTTFPVIGVLTFCLLLMACVLLNRANSGSYFYLH